MEMALTFNNVEFTTITRNNQPWIGSPQIGGALGYAKGKDSILKIYESHADEFTDEMTAVVKLPTEGGEQDVRIFSLRGCHLLAMFARTPVAKAFRKWVLDVLDRLDRERQMVSERNQLPPTDAPLTPDQQCTLRALVKARIESIPEGQRPKGMYPQVWSRFNNHFRIARYAQLPQCRMSEAIEYLAQMDMTPTALPQGNSSEIPNSSHIGFPVPIDAPKQLKALHTARQHCRFDFLPQAYSANDAAAAERHRMAEDLYKLQDCLWAALYNICSAAARLRS